MLTPKNLEIINAIDKNAPRHLGNNIHLTPTYTEVTDGVFAIRLTLSRQPAEDYPISDDLRANVCQRNHFIPRNVADTLLAAYRKLRLAKSHLPILRTIATEETEKSLKIGLTDLETRVILPISSDGETFPSIDRIIPPGEPETTFLADPGSLKNILSVCAPGTHIRIGLYAKERNMLRIEQTIGDTDQTLTAYLMLCELPEEEK